MHIPQYKANGETGYEDGGNAALAPA